MAEPIPFEEQAEALKLRAKPKPVTEINRKVVIAGAGVGAVLLFLAASVALDPPKVSGEDEPRELYNTRNKPKADALSTLPTSYDQMPAPKPAIELGPPIPGDLGGAMLAAERDLGIEPDVYETAYEDFRPDPLSEAERAERIRQAKLAQESLASPVFFKVSGKAPGKASDISPAPDPVDPFAAIREASAVLGVGGESDPNKQGSKIAFAHDAENGDNLNPHGLVDPVSPYQVMAGTIIPASLITGLNSDLPGTIIAQVTQPVYDTVSGAHLLIPQGARLIGRYDSQVSFGQDRALIVWDRVLFPDGASLQIDAMPGTDAAGYAGLSDKVDNHWGRIFVAAGLASLLGIGTELAVDDDDGLTRAIRDSYQDTANQAGQRIVDRNLNIQPTLKVRPGWPLRVIVTQDLVLRPYE
ncbi:TrbI/VirB10 family protein [Hyphococcus sp.]|uniref:TrbI/VirB10 family protein n=1 Tax=Hyphococcus sp. TaxID=2038636 RepID=UPI0020842061|nr:MAG: conjugal transfer protein TrbI [Marinicaulis sp.]